MNVDQDRSNHLPITDSRVCRILQLTDFHSDQSEFLNERTREDICAMVARHKPDFLAVTGDIWCSDAHPDAAAMWMQRDLEFLASLEIPWAFTWGNHDYAEDFAQAQARIESTPFYTVTESTGRGESHLAVSGPDIEPRWDLFFANTSDQWRLPRDLEWVFRTSEVLAESRQREVPAVLFFHIPLGRYQKAIDEGRIQGVAMEPVLCWGDEADTGADLIIASKNIRACFCGHSHLNDCWFEEGGVLFSYGRSTGHGGYGDELRKGAKLITLDLEKGTLTHETVFGVHGETPPGIC